MKRAPGTLLQHGSKLKAAKRNAFLGCKAFVYDVQGVLAAEYAVQAEPAACTTCYLSADHLGSTRMVTDAQGQVVSRHDHLPVGEEIPAGNGGRATQWGASDGVTQKFTGQEHDSEADLEFFHALYFSAAQQRFLSPDPMNAGMDLFSPQSWNAYAYVNNNPLSNTDPSGLGSMGIFFNPFRSEPSGSASSGGDSGRSGGGFTFWQSSNMPPAVSTIGPANRPRQIRPNYPKTQGRAQRCHRILLRILQTLSGPKRLLHAQTWQTTYNLICQKS